MMHYNDADMDKNWQFRVNVFQGDLGHCWDKFKRRQLGSGTKLPPGWQVEKDSKDTSIDYKSELKGI